MLTKLIVRNFKRFRNVEIELADPVVFIGPNNSGKTSALQALALWEIGLKRWNEKRKGEKTPEKRPGVTINRRDLVSAPVPNAKLLWRDLHVRVRGTSQNERTQNVRIDIIVEGITEDRSWQCGLEFDYANEESFYCRPLRLSEGKNSERMPIPVEAGGVQIAFLPPMSGLAANEFRLDPGAINVRVGEGRTAEVLRNLCHRLHEDDVENWGKLKKHIQSLFGSTLDEPEYVPERGEIEMSYLEKGVRLDLSCSGRGLQQTLLLLSYMYANPSAVLLLDEPDAHLEILRQRQIYQYLTDVARENGNQIIAASHSEILLSEASDRDAVVAFVGKPHLINDRGSQVLKALRHIGFEHYYQAEQMGWVLYLEGSTDLAILRAFAKILVYTEASEKLERPFVHYVGNHPRNVSSHFYGLREAVPNLKGIAVFDRLEVELPADLGAEGLMWQMREIENYLCYPETLEAYARASSSSSSGSAGPLFSQAEAENRMKAMQESIKEIENALQTLRQGSPWDGNTKVSDDFLVPLFESYFRKLDLPNVMAKKNFHELARLVPPDKIDPEIREKLDVVVRVAESAMPAGDIP
jgi:energy-coupling factor transporter ATP-binding protein EcfA2